jgi:hypothetical protein
MKILEYLKTNKQLREELEIKIKECDGWKKSTQHILGKSTTELAIEQVLGRNINWYKYQNLTTEEWREYYKEARDILKGKVLNNEINAFILDLVQEIAMRSKDFDHVLRLRAMINSAEVIRERLSKVVNPDKEEVSNKNIYNAI